MEQIVVKRRRAGQLFAFVQQVKHVATLRIIPLNAGGNFALQYSHIDRDVGLTAQ